MKKYVLLTALVCVALLMTLATIQASQGAVKMDLYEMPLAENDEVMGWAIVNITPDGLLIVQIHLHDGWPNELFMVKAKAREPGQTVKSVVEFPDELETNAKGKGNAHVVRDISEIVFVEGNIEVSIAVITSSTVGYHTDWTKVPLK